MDAGNKNYATIGYVALVAMLGINILIPSYCNKTAATNLEIDYQIWNLQVPYP